jgi:hypothetical protein
MLKLLFTSMCGERTTAEDFGPTLFVNGLGLRRTYQLFAQVLNPLYLIPKALSYAPKIGPTFKKIPDFFEKPSKKMNDLSKDLKEKCDEVNPSLNSILLVLKYIGWFQLGIQIIDKAILPAYASSVCAAINAGTLALFKKDGRCSREKMETSGAYDRDLSLAKIGILADTGAFVMQTYLRYVREIEDAVDKASSVVSPLLPPLEEVVDALSSINEAFKPLLEAFEPHKGLFDSLYSVLKYIQCPAEYIGPICSIQDLLEEGFNKILDTFGIPNLDDLMDEILDAFGIPSLDITWPLDLGFTSPFEMLISDIQQQLNKFLEVSRDSFDPSARLEAAINGILVNSGGGVDWTVHITTSTDGFLNFACADGARPVAYKAEGSRWSCTQDMSGLYRFPCDNNPTCNGLNFGQWSRCNDPDPNGAEVFKNFEPAFFSATYYCIPNTEDPEVLSVLF